MYLNSKSLSKMEKSKSEVSLKQLLRIHDLQWKRIMVETHYKRIILHQLALQILKAFLAIADDFNRQFFLIR